MKAIVVVPTYNEIQNLGNLVTSIRQAQKQLHILVVDDSSPDGTGALADELSRTYPGEILALHRPKKEGLGRAYVAGFTHALALGYDVILQMDADLSHDPAYLGSFLEQIKDCDVVLGSRYLQGISVVNWDLKRLVLSKLASKYVQWITWMPFTDGTSGFKCWRRAVLQAIGLDQVFSNGYCFQIEMTYRAYVRGFRIKEIPIIFFERKLGHSKFQLNIILEAIWGVVRLRLGTTKPD